MIKLVIVILILAFGYSHGGWGGVWGMLFLMTLVLAPFAYGDQSHRKPVETPNDEPWEETTNVRKGRRIDPTAAEDAAGMIANNYGRRRA